MSAETAYMVDLSQWSQDPEPDVIDGVTVQSFDAALRAMYPADRIASMVLGPAATAALEDDSGTPVAYENLPPDAVFEMSDINAQQFSGNFSSGANTPFHHNGLAAWLPESCPSENDGGFVVSLRNGPACPHCGSRDGTKELQLFSSVAQVCVRCGQ